MATEKQADRTGTTLDTAEIWHIEGRRSFRLAWLCEELDVAYRLKFTEGDIVASWLAIRADFPGMPLSPVTRLGDQWVVETGGIAEVLLARAGNGRLVPDVASKDFVAHCQWMHFSEGTMSAMMAKTRYVAEVLGIPVDQLPRGYNVADPDKPIDPSNPMDFAVGMRAIFDFIEHHLQSHPYFGGSQFSAADIMMHFPIQMSEIVVWAQLVEYPGITRWLADVEQRPAFLRAQAACLPKGGDQYGQPLNAPHPFAGRPAQTV